MKRNEDIGFRKKGVAKKRKSRRRPLIRKGDLVEVLSGEDRGKRGKVLRVLPDTGRVIVEKVNFIKRHTRPSQRNQQGGIVEREAPIHISNVAIVVGEERAKVGWKRLADGRRVRYVKTTGEMLSQ
jgi:large subunit ribosomal protein L24